MHLVVWNWNFAMIVPKYCSVGWMSTIYVLKTLSNIFTPVLVPETNLDDQISTAQKCFQAVCKNGWQMALLWAPDLDWSLWHINKHWQRAKLHLTFPQWTQRKIWVPHSVIKQIIINGRHEILLVLTPCTWLSLSISLVLLSNWLCL